MTSLHVKVTPKASKNEIIGWEGDQLKVRLTAAPEKGKANHSLIALLSKTLKIAKSRIHILKGETSRLKIVEIEGETLSTLKKKLTDNS